MKLFSAFFLLALFIMTTGSAAQPAPEKFSLDKDLTYVGFEVRYLLLLRVTGQFDDFEGAFVIDRQQPENNRADIIIKTASVNTGVKSRDQDIRGPALFNADIYPEMVFHSDHIVLRPDNTGIITGHLTLRGITKPITLELTRVEEEGAQITAHSNSFADGFLVTGKIKRSDFGMNEFIMPIGDTVTLYVCYKLKTCDGTDTRRRKAAHKYNQ